MSTFEPHELARQNRLAGVPLASFARRAAAFVFDFLAAFSLFLFILIFGAKLLIYLELINPDTNLNLKFDLKHWYSLAFLVLYFGLFTYFSNGKTPGKWLFKIRVVSLAQERISLWHSIERALGYGASILELGFGFLQYFIHSNKRTVHDRIAETIVIRESPVVAAPKEDVSPE
ncbi:MAG: RDD family protein [candidate division Zixibacteria bacterium]|nr:RDD family protein [candidate division Zixibacteria bacterium]